MCYSHTEHRRPIRSPSMSTSEGQLSAASTPTEARNGACFSVFRDIIKVAPTGRSIVEKKVHRRQGKKCKHFYSPEKKNTAWWRATICKDQRRYSPKRASERFKKRRSPFRRSRLGAFRCAWQLSGLPFCRAPEADPQPVDDSGSPDAAEKKLSPKKGKSLLHSCFSKAGCQSSPPFHWGDTGTVPPRFGVSEDFRTPTENRWGYEKPSMFELVAQDLGWYLNE